MGSFFLRIGLMALAGSLGTLARYGTALAVQSVAGRDFPWGTVVVNVLGCFLFGLGWSVITHRFLLGDDVKLIVLTGFMGAFTTFSTYLFETHELLRAAQWWHVAANVAIQNVIGLIALAGGIGLGRAV